MPRGGGGCKGRVDAIGQRARLAAINRRVFLMFKLTDDLR